MEDDWEAVADKEVIIRPRPAANVNKWEGEDEDDDVKDSWEDEEEKKDEEKVETKAAAPAKTKASNELKAKLTEEARLAELAEEERLANLTPEEKAAEKLRLQKIQEESDLRVALETLGISSTQQGGGLDAFNPQSKEEFKEFGATLSWKLTQYKESPHFPQFVEDFVRSICCNLTASDMKKVKMSIENLHSEKLKLERQNNKKNAGKSHAKATLKADIDDIGGYQKYGDNYVTETFDDYDDFM